MVLINMTKVITHYQCPRCNYKTLKKTDMKKHLYNLKKPCGATQQDIELSDEQKEKILQDRILKTPPQPPTPIIQNNTLNHVINNYNQINNLINKMDPIEKISRYTEYKSLELMDFEDKIEEQYCLEVRRLDLGKAKHFQMDKNSFLSVIDTITTIQDIDKLNIIYDEVPNKIKVFTCGEWRSSLLDAGVQEMIFKIKGCYLDFYECYLLRKYYDPALGQQQRSHIKELIEDYYKFISCFDILPFAKDKNDNEILYRADDPRHHQEHEFTIEEQWYPCYKRIKAALMMSEVKSVKKEVADIVKKNTRSNVIELNKKMMEVIQMDEEFKDTILNDLMCVMRS